MQKIPGTKNYTLKWTAPPHNAKEFTSIQVNCNNTKTDEAVTATGPVTRSQALTVLTEIANGVTYDCEAFFKKNDSKLVHKFPLTRTASIGTKSADRLAPGK